LQCVASSQTQEQNTQWQLARTYMHMMHDAYTQGNMKTRRM